MKHNPKPVQKAGKRNFFCMYYSDCLDHAAKRYWQSWSCRNCHMQHETQPGVQGPVTSGDAVIYYSIPQEICQKIEAV